MKYTAREIENWETHVYSENCAKWIPARPLNYQTLSVKQRLILAWYVFIGKYDVLDWEE